MLFITVRSVSLAQCRLLRSAGRNHGQVSVLLQYSVLSLSAVMLSLLGALYAFASTTNLFVYLRRRYCHRLVQDLNRIIRLKGRCIRATENVAFLRKCLEAYVTPFHIRKRVQKAKPKHPWAIERAFLHDELYKHQDDLEAIEDYKRTLPTIRKELSFFDQLRFCKLISRTADRLCKQVRRDKNASLQRLRKAQLGQGELDHSVIINLAGIELSDVQKDVLCRGLNFSMPPRTDNISNEVKAEFELSGVSFRGTNQYPMTDRKALLESMLVRRWTRLAFHSGRSTLMQFVIQNKLQTLSSPDRIRGMV